MICSLERSDIHNLLLYDAAADDEADDDVDGERAVCKTIRNQKEIPFKPKLNAAFRFFCFSKRAVAIEWVHVFIRVYACVCVAISGRYFGS